LFSPTNVPATPSTGQLEMERPPIESVQNLYFLVGQQYRLNSACLPERGHLPTKWLSGMGWAKFGSTANLASLFADFSAV